MILFDTTFLVKIKYDLQNFLPQYLVRNMSCPDIVPWPCACHLEMTKENYLDILFLYCNPKVFFNFQTRFDFFLEHPMLSESPEWHCV